MTRIIVALAILGVWLGAMAFGGPTFGKISEVSTNDQATFLPATAESTRAGEIAQRFDGGDAIPAIIVGEIASPADLAALDDTGEQLRGVDGVGSVIGPLPSEDGKAAQFVVLIDATDSSEAVSGVVGELRDVAAAAEVADLHVTGPAGFATDLGAAFAGIDGLLLLVTLAAVMVILVVVYRSVLLPIIVVATSMAALCAAIVTIYWLARWGVIVLNGQAQGIVSILVIGATTDYALLLVARHREELTREANVMTALRTSVRGSFGAISASAATVAVAVLCMLVSDLNSNKSLGPVAAIGIAYAWAAGLTLLPVLLGLGRRAVFWPAAPKVTDDTDAAHHGVWGRVSDFVAAAPRKVWVVTLLVLLAGAVWAPTLRADGVSTNDILLGESDAKAGQEVLGAHFDAGSGSPVTIIAPTDTVTEVLSAVDGREGMSSATVTGPGGAPGGPDNAQVVDGMVLVQATLTDPAESPAAEATVVTLREDLHAIDGDILVGGTTATAVDSTATSQRDLRLILPLVLAVVLAVLVVLLRSILLPVLLVGATVVSFGTAIGVSALVFNHVFNFPGADPSVPLYGFVFLVALGVDYTIFLMTRAREETADVGTRKAVLRSLAVTGGVITSAGVVLAATFAALAVIPLMFMVQLAFIVAFGVLVDTLLVRTLLIPGLVLDIGPAVWWPWRKQVEPATTATTAE
ncbi:MMPL family transporter [Corynebacterium uterequi]|uniref:MMPL family transporter n=1 Tax=Corynebacterium uterequi TaxID=1072256 RepID=UPI002E81D90F|nr:MMPL family transporter [Corynebacterium uterequi]